MVLPRVEQLFESAAAGVAIEACKTDIELAIPTTQPRTNVKESSKDINGPYPSDRTLFTFQRLTRNSHFGP